MINLGYVLTHYQNATSHKWARTINHYPVRIPGAIYRPYTEPTHVWRIIENLKIKPLKWVKREIDLASFNFGMPCVQSTCSKRTSPPAPSIRAFSTRCWGLWQMRGWFS